MITEEDITLIEGYLGEDLTEEQRVAFEDRLKNDRDLAAHLKLMSDLPAAINSDVDLFRDKWSQMVAEERAAETKPTKVRSIRPLYLLIAAMLVGAVFGTFMFNSTSSSNLYAEHFTMPPENISTRANDGIEQLQGALDAYQQEDYQTAVAQFEGYLTAHPNDWGTKFYYGASLMALDRQSDARITLSEVAEQQGNYQGAAQYYLALSYLKSEDEDAAKRVLTILGQSDSSYSKQAQTILHELR